MKKDIKLSLITDKTQMILDKTKKEPEQDSLVEAHQEINKVKTDLLIHIDEMIENDSDIEYWSNHLSNLCNIPFKEAKQLILDNLS